jgi:hypothetical protein
MRDSQYTEDTLVQQTTADYLEKQLGWQSVYAYNQEDSYRQETKRSSGISGPISVCGNMPPCATINMAKCYSETK